MSEQTIHCCTRRDLAEVAAIDDGSFREPWAEADFERALAPRNRIGIVIRSGEAVVAYAIYELEPGGLQVLRLAVRPDHRRRGLGRLLLARLTAKATGNPRRQVRIDVPDDNLAAHLWLRECGWQAVGVLADAYRFVGRVPVRDGAAA